MLYSHLIFSFMFPSDYSNSPTWFTEIRTDFFHLLKILIWNVALGLSRNLSLID